MNEIQVRIGEVKQGKADDLLKATLGSCVGIAFYWKKKKSGALAHCLLPGPASLSNFIGAKYVTQAIPSLMALLKIAQDDIPEIEVSVYGGANMMEQLSQSNISQVGKHNAEMAIKLLSELGFKVKHSRLGGSLGRQVSLNCSNGEVEVIELNDNQRKVV